MTRLMNDVAETVITLLGACAVIALGAAGLALVLFLWAGFMGGPIWLLLWILS